MYLLDPARGRRRRAHLVDALGHARRVELDLFGRAARDASYRIQGALERVRHPPAGDAGDEVVTARVTSQLGRTISHPSAIDAVVRDGVVTLRGPILESEAMSLLQTISHVAGVQSVVDELERHETAEGVPELQGGRERRRTELWTPAAQAGAVIGGGLLAAWGALVRGGLAGTAWLVTGGALALRGGLNMPLSRIFGLGNDREGVIVQKTITVRAPVEAVFAMWAHIENFPRFMQHVKRIERAGHTRTCWTVDGPAGVPITFETITTKVDPDREVAWETLPDQTVEHSGRVRFERVSEGCRIDVRMTYRPPAGMLGHAVAHLLGSDPKQRMDDDLVRLKTLLEKGHTRAHGERVHVAELLAKPGS